MKKIGVILLTGFSIFLAPTLRAQSEDPSEVFLKAYMTAQQGEKLEHENNFRDALAKFRFAGRIAGGAAQTSRRLAAGDRGISQPQNQRKYFARRRQSRDPERF